MAESETETRSKGIFLFVIAVLAGVILVAVFFIRANVSHSRDQSICNRVNALYDILEREHKTKYRRLQVYLLQHPEGTPGITRDDLLNGLKDERAILGDLDKRCVT